MERPSHISSQQKFMNLIQRKYKFNKNIWSSLIDVAILCRTRSQLTV